MALDARRCFKEFAPLSGLDISRERDQVSCWKTTDGGAMYSVGVMGTATGRGANVLIIDDYFKNRAEADSEVMRNKLWDCFRNNLFNRLAPVHAVIVVANRWHEDDLVGRILESFNKKSDSYDPDFPKFDVIKFPAQDEEGNWLFPERFDDSWPRIGNMLRVDCVKIVDDIDAIAGPDGWEWGLDLAHTKKERVKDDPDYTHGTLGKVDTKTREIFIKDAFETQKAAIQRDTLMKEKIESSGASHVTMEVFLDAIDAFDYAKEALKGIATVTAHRTKHDLVSTAGYLEPIFEIGNVTIQRGAWNAPWMKWMKGFPGAKHDDAIGSLVALTYKALVRNKRMGLSL